MKTKKQILKRLMELEQRAISNREKYDDTPIYSYLDVDDEAEYHKLISEYEVD